MILHRLCACPDLPIQKKILLLIFSLENDPNNVSGILAHKFQLCMYAIKKLFNSVRIQQGKGIIRTPCYGSENL